MNRRVSICALAAMVGLVSACGASRGSTDPAIAPLATTDPELATTAIPALSVPPTAPTAPEVDASTTIDQAEAWFDDIGDSYSYYLECAGPVTDEIPCDRSTFRIVVTDGAVVDAVEFFSPTSPGARLAVGDIPSISELIEIIREIADTPDMTVSSDGPDLDNLRIIVRDYYSERVLRISGVSESTAPSSIGWDEVRADADAAQARWSQQSFDHIVTIDSYGLSQEHGERVTTIVDGQPVKVVDLGEEVDPSTIADSSFPHTIDDLFDVIDDEAGDGYVFAIFDPDTGVPTSLSFDPLPEAIDDEVGFVAKIERL